MYKTGSCPRASVFVVLLMMECGAAAQNEGPDSSPWIYGGGFGAAFGDIFYFEISPLVGYKIYPRTAVGLSFLYRYTENRRYQESFSTSDYGTTFFIKYRVAPNLFLQTEYEYLNYELALIDDFGRIAKVFRKDFSGLFAGGGVLYPVGDAASMYIAALYNFNYSRENSPYPSAVSLRFGIGIGF